jgi:hypothetical protein
MDDDACPGPGGREGVRLTRRATERDGHPGIRRRPRDPLRGDGTQAAHGDRDLARGRQTRRVGPADEVGQLGAGVVPPDRGVLEQDVVAREDQLGGGAEQSLRIGP